MALAASASASAQKVTVSPLPQEIKWSSEKAFDKNTAFKVKGLKSADRTMIVVTHEMEFARNVADKVIFMADGKIVEENTPEEFFAHPRESRTQDFLAKVL